MAPARSANSAATGDVRLVISCVARERVRDVLRIGVTARADYETSGGHGRQLHELTSGDLAQETLLTMFDGIPDGAQPCRTRILIENLAPLGQNSELITRFW